MSEWKKMVCVDDGGVGFAMGSLVLGKVYKVRVTSIAASTVEVEGVSGRWSHTRFQPLLEEEENKMEKFLTIVESPYAGDVKGNEEYLKKCIKHSIALGETPFASHGFYTRYLDDTNPCDRELGISMGFKYHQAAVKCVFYVDRGMSKGMLAGLQRAIDLKLPTEFRYLGVK